VLESTAAALDGAPSARVRDEVVGSEQGRAFLLHLGEVYRYVFLSRLTRLW
jgi:hypothetical protein